MTNELSIVQGENKTVELTIAEFDNSDPPLLIPIDLTGGTVTLTVRLKAREPTVLIQKTSATPAEITILNQITDKGRADIFFVPGDTTAVAIKPGQFVYDIWFEDSTGERFAAISISRFDILQRVTIL